MAVEMEVYRPNGDGFKNGPIVINDSLLPNDDSTAQWKWNRNQQACAVIQIILQPGALSEIFLFQLYLVRLDVPGIFVVLIGHITKDSNNHDLITTTEYFLSVELKVKAVVLIII